MDIKAFEYIAIAMMLLGDIMTIIAIFTSVATFLLRIIFWRDLGRFIRAGWLAATSIFATGIGILSKYTVDKSLVEFQNGMLIPLEDSEISLILFGCLLLLLTATILPPLGHKKTKPSETHKKCPHCQATIYIAATTCTKCHRVLDWSIVQSKKL